MKQTRDEGLDTAKWDAVTLILQERYTTLWFLAALFLGILIFDAIFRVTKGGRALYLICVGVSAAFILYDTFVAVPLPWNLDTAFIIQIYLAFGHYART